MSSSSFHPVFAKAAHAVLSDNRDETRQNIDWFLAEEPDSIEAWLLKAWTCDSLEAAQYCFQRALELEPEHLIAQAGANWIQGVFYLAEEQVEAERLEQERLEQERLEQERLEQERLEAERLERERLEAEQRELERLEKERLEAERLEAERLEQERLEQERLEQERLEQERLGAPDIDVVLVHSQRAHRRLHPLLGEVIADSRTVLHPDLYLLLRVRCVLPHLSRPVFGQRQRCGPGLDHGHYHGGVHAGRGHHVTAWR